MINYTKFRSDLYSYKYCVDFLRKRRNLSLTRRIDLVTRTRYPWTELQSDEAYLALLDAEARANDWSEKARAVVQGLKKQEKLPGD